MTSSARSAAGRARNAPGARLAARLGFAMNGLVNATIGVLAIAVTVLGASGTADPNGALSGLAQAPGGQVLIIVIVIGLAALGLWQLTSAVIERGSDAGNVWAARAKFVGKGIAYLALAAIGVGIALGSDSSGGEESFTASALATPGGVVLIVVIGLAAVAVGGYMVVKGIRQGFLDDITPPTGAARRATIVVGVSGYVARGIAFAVIGVLFIAAAVTSDASEAGGLDDALAALTALPFGRILLIAIAVGFIAFGIYGFVRARYAKL